MIRCGLKMELEWDCPTKHLIAHPSQVHPSQSVALKSILGP